MASDTYVDLHLLVDAIVHDQTVGQPNAMGLHGMAGNVGKVADVRVVEIGDLLRRRSSQGDAISIQVNRSCVCHFCA